MARGKRKLSLEEQLENITNEIENMENSIKEMKQAKKELEYQIKLAHLSEIDNWMTENNLIFDDVKALLTNN